MISSIKHILLFLLVSIICPMVIAAEINFYKLISVEGTNSVKINGGQFITFVADRCFDSNKDGVSVKNGNLDINPYQSTASKLVYSGVSYWGKCKYVFTNSKNNLKVITSNGSVYLYAKSMPPSGKQTCSLIKSQSDKYDRGSGDAGFACDNGGGYNNGQYNQHNSGYSSGNSNSHESGNQPRSNNASSKQRHTCPRCNGNRRIVYEANSPSFGNDYKKRCSECGGIFWASTGHTHITCPQCHGKGYF